MNHDSLQHEIHKRGPFDSAEQEAFLNIRRSAAALGVPFDRLFKTHGLTAASYNVLRILRGAGKSGRECHEVGEHMVAHVPDVTRLVDRLERSGFVTRARCDKDRRVIHVTITDRGLGVLSELDRPLLAMHRQQLGHLTRGELTELNRILVKARRLGEPGARARAPESPRKGRRA